MSDPRFLDVTVEEMMSDYWAHHFADNPKALEEFVDEDFNQEAILAQWAAEEEAAGNVTDWEDVDPT